MTPGEIARGLSKAQRDALLGAERAHGSAGILVLPLNSDAGKLSRSLVDAGLAGFSSRGAALNKTGKAVRFHLQQAAVRALLEQESRDE